MNSRKVCDNWGREIVIYTENRFSIAMHGGVQVCAGSPEQVSLWLTRTAAPTA